MNKQTEDKILEMLFHVHEKSTGAHPLDPQKDGVQWWIKRCGGTRSLRTQISYMDVDAYSAEEFWLKYGHDDLFPREHLFRFFFFLKGVFVAPACGDTATETLRPRILPKATTLDLHRAQCPRFALTQASGLA